MGIIKTSFRWFISCVIPVITIIFWICPQNKIWLHIQNRPGWFWALLLIIFILGFALSFLPFPRKSQKNDAIDKIDLSQFTNRNNDQKRYSVVLVDDMFKNQSTLNLYRDQLNNYNICFLPSVSDINMLVGFDVIILDVMGTGFKMGNKGAHGDINAYLRELFAKCPYKYTIAISTERERLRRDDVAAFSYETIVKNIIIDNNQKRVDHDTVIESVRNSLSRAFVLLDSPASFWENMIINKIQDKESRSRAKTNYIYHLLMQGRSTI